MKKILLFLCLSLAGCGPKSNDEIAHDLVTEKLKSVLPNFDTYEAVNYGMLGKAFLPYEETEPYIRNTAALAKFKDSVTILQEFLKNKKSGTAGNAGAGYQGRLQQLMDSIRIKNDSINAGKSVYVPIQLFKITHAYKVKDKSGMPKTTEEAFYFDKDLKRVVKVQKIY